MKRLLLISLIALCLMDLSAQSDLSSSIRDGAQLNEDQKALSELEKLKAEGHNHPDLYFNLGVCHNKLGRPGLATLYYLKTLSLDSAHPEARHNLKLLQDLSPSKANQENNPFLVQLLYDILAWLNHARLAIIVLVFLGLTVLCAHWLLHYSPDAEKGPPILLLSICTLLLVMASTVLIVKQQRSSRDNRAVVTVPLATIYKDEGTLSSPENLPETSIVRIVSQRRDLYQARLQDGSLVWIKRADLTRLQDI